MLDELDGDELDMSELQRDEIELGKAEMRLENFAFDEIEDNEKTLEDLLNAINNPEPLSDNRW